MAADILHRCMDKKVFLSSSLLHLVFLEVTTTLVDHMVNNFFFQTLVAGVCKDNMTH